MRLLALSVMLIVLFLSINSVQADVGFGLTETQSQVTMNSDMNRVCATYFLYNPGDVEITGFLDIDREGGGTLNKLLGLTLLYEELDKLDADRARLEEELDAVPEGESTFEVEKKLADVEESAKPINEEIEKRKPTKDTIQIPAHTPPSDEDGNYQIPLEICFDRPMERYFLSTIGDTDFCGTFEGEVVGRYDPSPREGQGTGSAITGSRSTRLIVQVKCNVYEKGAALTKAVIYALVAILIIGGIIIWVRRRIKLKKRKSQVKLKKRQGQGIK